MDDLVSEFVEETREGLQLLDTELVRFEQQPDDPATLGGIFRLVHTIKGAGGFLGLSRLQAVAHAAENVLGAFRDGELAVTPEAVTAVLETVDLVRNLVDALASSGEEPVGDDCALIGRLERLFQARGAAQETPEPMAPTGSANPLSLLQRLGGEATLDAAAEMAVACLAPAGEGVDVEAQLRAHGVLRDALVAAARDSGAVARWPDLFGNPASTIEALTNALTSLEVDQGAVTELLRTDASEAQPLLTTSEGAKPPEESKAAQAPDVAANQSIRVSVAALEHLMTVVSELVLIRNQLIQVLRSEPESRFAAPLNRLNQVTSELQERVMTTRMQPIGGAWSKLPRLVRDLAHELGKSIELEMNGQETELDRQVLELIRDPLTHMIRNAADHGLETPAERRAAGKAATGRISLNARHEGGAIVIEVADDGRGLALDRIRAKALRSGLATQSQLDQMGDPEVRQLIFRPGFSTAANVTSISGRGVGMDVVRTNIEQIGGAIELHSTEGKGSRFTIRIPLTLTIVSALIVECGGQRFALPQSSVVELVSASGASRNSVETLNGAPVFRLRDRLLPLIELNRLLGLSADGDGGAETCIVVARLGAFSFGIIVDRVYDTEEIVVKPVAKVLRHLGLYSGATILGDGSVILILDPKGLSAEAGADQADRAGETQEAIATASAPLTSLLVFRAADGRLKAAPLGLVSRIEEIASEQVEWVEGRTTLQYRGELMPIMTAEGDPVSASWEGARLPLLVFAFADGALGVLAHEIVDIVDVELPAMRPAGASASRASLIVAGRAAELVDVDFYRGRTGPPAQAAASEAKRRLLVIDDSPFSQLFLQRVLSQAGYEVTVVHSPAAALKLHEAGEQFDLILTDTRRDSPHAAAIAESLVKARQWHGTPLLGLALGEAGRQGLDPELQNVLSGARAAA